MVVVKWRALIRLAVVIGAVAAAGLTADVIAAGLAQAAGLAGVMTGFCELGGLTLCVVGWLGRRRDSGRRVEQAPAEMPEDDRSASAAGSGAEKYAVDARGAQGVQVGDYATQHNHFGHSAVPGKPGKLHER